MEIRAHLEFLLNDFLVHGGRYKVRAQWFQGVLADLDCLVAEGGVLNQTLVLEVEDFSRYYSELEFDCIRITRRDILRADSLNNSNSTKNCHGAILC